MSVINVVFDMDDVLNNLNDYVMHKLKLPFASRFEIDKCIEYTEDEKRLILSTYSDIDTFRNLSFVTGATDVISLEKLPGVQVWVNTTSFTEAIAEFKRGQLINDLHINPSRAILQVGHKQPLDIADYMVEDHIVNLRGYSKDCTKILINKSHNQAESYNTTDEAEGIVRVPNLVEALRYIKTDIKKRINIK